jgi:hypothetical protein
MTQRQRQTLPTAVPAAAQTSQPPATVQRTGTEADPQQGIVLSYVGGSGRLGSYPQKSWTLAYASSLEDDELITAVQSPMYRRGPHYADLLDKKAGLRKFETAIQEEEAKRLLEKAQAEAAQAAPPLEQPAPAPATPAAPATAPEEGTK